MSDQFKFTLYAWVDWAMKAVLLGGVALIWQIYNDLQHMTMMQSNQAIMQVQQAQRIEKLEAKADSMQREYVSRVEALEMMKRVEMQLTIISLQGSKGKKP
jgi:hypothetical protein